MKRIVLIGSCFSSRSGGPSAIVRGLDRHLEKTCLSHTSILNNENCGKVKVLMLVFKEVLWKKGNVVNIHTYGYILPFIVYICSVLNRKNEYYLTVHGVYEIEAEYEGKARKVNRSLQRFLCQRFSNIICVSEFLKETLKELYGRSKNVYVIPNATDATDYTGPKKLTISSGTIKFIMLGGIRRRKGIFEIVDLLNYLIHQKGLDIKCEVYGSVDSETLIKEFERFVEEKNLKECIVYKGKFEDKQKIYSLVAQSDFQLCLSYYDTFNVAVAESLVLGCPCICSNKCGAAYLVENGTSGLIVDMDHDYKDEVWQYVNSFLEDPCKKQRVCEMAEKIKEIVSWEAVGTSYVQLMEGRNN